MVQQPGNAVFNNESQKADQLEITYFTDPLCCWSWGFEPQWRKLRFEFDGQISWRYCMAGLLPDWKNFNDEANSVHRPLQMGPVWMHASQLSGMPMHTRVWMEDPPASSYPACIAVKCAALQSAEAGEKFLRLTREAIMINGQNIAKLDILESIADQVAKQSGLLDLEKFKSDMHNDVGLNAFKKDMELVHLSGINRYPSLLIRSAQAKSILVTGYRPYSVLLDAIRQIAPTLSKSQTASKSTGYINFWDSITQTELREVDI